MRRLQGAWYLLSGAWALLHRSSFEAVTGPKRDYWLVQAIAGLTMAIGAVLLLPAREKEAERRARLLSALSALAFAGVELRHGLPGRIRPIYLLDAVGELAFAGSAFLGGVRRRGGTPTNRLDSRQVTVPRRGPASGRPDSRQV